MNRPREQAENSEIHEQHRAIIRDRIEVTIQDFDKLSPALLKINKDTVRDALQTLDGLVTVKQINGLSDELRAQIFESCLGVSKLMTKLELKNFTFEQIKQLEPKLLKLSYGVFLLMKRGVAFDQIIKLKPDVRTQILESSLAWSNLMDKGATFDQIKQLEPDVRTQILQSHSSVSNLMDREVAFDQIIKLKPDVRTQILQSSSEVITLMSVEVTFDQIIELDSDVRAQVLESSYSVSMLMGRGVTFDQILELEPDVRAKVLDSCFHLDFVQFFESSSKRY